MVSVSVLGGGRSATSAFLIGPTCLIFTRHSWGNGGLSAWRISNTIHQVVGNLGLCQSEFPGSFHNHSKICHGSRSSKSECCIFTGNFIFCHRATNRNEDGGSFVKVTVFFFSFPHSFSLSLLSLRLEKHLLMGGYQVEDAGTFWCGIFPGCP